MIFPQSPKYNNAKKILRLLCLDVCSKIKFERVFIVLSVRLTFSLLPHSCGFPVREKGVGLFGCVLYFCQVEYVGLWQRVAVQLFATDDVDGLLVVYPSFWFLLLWRRSNLIQKDIQIPISGITSPVLMLFNFCLTYSQLGRIFSALSFL